MYKCFSVFFLFFLLGLLGPRGLFCLKRVKPTFLDVLNVLEYFFFILKKALRFVCIVSIVEWCLNKIQSVSARNEQRELTRAPVLKGYDRGLAAHLLSGGTLRLSLCASRSVMPQYRNRAQYHYRYCAIYSNRATRKATRTWGLSSSIVLFSPKVKDVVLWILCMPHTLFGKSPEICVILPRVISIILFIHVLCFGAVDAWLVVIQHAGGESVAVVSRRDDCGACVGSFGLSAFLHGHSQTIISTRVLLVC